MRISARLLLALPAILVITSASFAAPPQWTATKTPQHQAVTLGQAVTLSGIATGTPPLNYQWLLAGRILSDQTNQTLTISSAQPSDEGIYTVRVTNAEGEATSVPARLWVVPPSASFTRANYTNSAGDRLPYSWLTPTNYTPARTYPLVFFCIGLPAFLGEEEQWQVVSDSSFHFFKVFASYRQQVVNPVVMVWLSRRTGQISWDTNFVRSIPELILDISARFSIDTNRIYAIGGAEPVAAIMETVRLRPELVAAAVFYAPITNIDGVSVTPIKHLPIWNLSSVAEDYALAPVVTSRQLISALRRAGNPAVYTELATATHVPTLCTGMCIPAMVDWLLAQRRGIPSREDPLLVITEPTEESTYATGGASLNLSGSAQALGEGITGVTWEATWGRGNAAGTDSWTVTNVLLALNRTNTVIVTAATTSWAPAYGGNTTFSKTLFVLSKPIRASLTLQAGGATLDWTGGGPPFRVQKAAELGNWIDLVADATPPVVVSLDNSMGFFRIIGR